MKVVFCLQLKTSNIKKRHFPLEIHTFLLSQRAYSMMLCKIFLHLCEVFLTFFLYITVFSEPNVYISFAVQKIAVYCCPVVYTEMCIKHFVIFWAALFWFRLHVRGVRIKRKSCQNSPPPPRKAAEDDWRWGGRGVPPPLVVLMGLGEGEGENHFWIRQSGCYVWGQPSASFIFSLFVWGFVCLLF